MTHTVHDRFDEGIRWLLAGLVFVLCGVGPWLFGAWEMWWFWRFSLVGCGAIFVYAVLLLRGKANTLFRDESFLLCAALTFLCYALWRALTTEVIMDAQRSFLLHFSGVMVCLVVLTGLRRRQRLFLFAGLMVSLVLMAGYGIINHIVDQSRLVLWLPRFEQYAGRATGPYFCPNHFAGAMEILFCMGIGLFLDRCSRPASRWFGLASILLAFTGMVMSQSRGSGITLVGMLVLIMVWGFRQWPRKVRWYWRLLGASSACIVVILVTPLAQGYIERFSQYHGFRASGVTHEESSVFDEIGERLARTSRGRMFGGAWRAWQRSPWFGIGAGMHQHVWFEVAASPDGDRASGKWPTLVNEDFHSYEVHSDWLQLMEEFGVIGLVLFWVPVIMVCVLLLRRLESNARVWRYYELESYETRTPRGFSQVLAAGVAIGAMIIHSIGDFNLQMPGTVWLLGAVVALGLAVRHDER